MEAERRHLCDGARCLGWAGGGGGSGAATRARRLPWPCPQATPPAPRPLPSADAAPPGRPGLQGAGRKRGRPCVRPRGGEPPEGLAWPTCLPEQHGLHRLQGPPLSSCAARAACMPTNHCPAPPFRPAWLSGQLHASTHPPSLTCPRLIHPPVYPRTAPELQAFKAAFDLKNIVNLPNVPPQLGAFAHVKLEVVISGIEPKTGGWAGWPMGGWGCLEGGWVGERLRVRACRWQGGCARVRTCMHSGLQSAQHKLPPWSAGMWLGAVVIRDAAGAIQAADGLFGWCAQRAQARRACACAWCRPQSASSRAASRSQHPLLTARAGCTTCRVSNEEGTIKFVGSDGTPEISLEARRGRGPAQAPAPPAPLGAAVPAAAAAAPAAPRSHSPAISQGPPPPAPSLRPSPGLPEPALRLPARAGDQQARGAGGRGDRVPEQRVSALGQLAAGPPAAPPAGPAARHGRACCTRSRHPAARAPRLRTPAGTCTGPCCLPPARPGVPSEKRLSSCGPPLLPASLPSPSSHRRRPSLRPATTPRPTSPWLRSSPRSCSGEGRAGAAPAWRRRPPACLPACTRRVPAPAAARGRCSRVACPPLRQRSCRPACAATTASPQGNPEQPQPLSWRSREAPACSGPAVGCGRSLPRFNASVPLPGPLPTPCRLLAGGRPRKVQPSVTNTPLLPPPSFFNFHLPAWRGTHPRDAPLCSLSRTARPLHHALLSIRALQCAPSVGRLPGGRAPSCHSDIGSRDAAARSV